MVYKKGDYDRYYNNDDNREAQKLRIRNRRAAMKKGIVHPGDGMEIDHKDGNPKDNSKKNLQVISRHKNRVKQ